MPAAFALAILLLMAGAWLRAAEPVEPRGAVLVLPITGAIGPATTDLVRRAIDRAEAEAATALILRIDTPGGLDAATRDIDQAILAAPVPVIGWVAPAGARAASAGTYMLYATHLAAMAPGTNVGAATPIAIGGTPARPARPTDDDNGDDQSRPAEAESAAERKAVHDSAAYLRSMAELRGRNAEWAERAVRFGESLTAREALEQNVIELLAADLPALLQQADGREVQLAGGTVRLETADAVVTELEPGWRHSVLAVLTHPSVAYLLLLAGLYGLLLEGYNPGALVPGITGLLCLLLAGYALQLLPVNYAGLGLIAVGVALMFAELVTPSLGVFGVAGVIALVLGSIMLFDTDVPGFGVSRGLIGGIAVIGAGGLLLLIGLFKRARGRPVTTGTAELLASPAIAHEDFIGRGHVRIRGELWQAESAVPVKAGQALRVRAVDGLTLQVEPY